MPAPSRPGPIESPDLSGAGTNALRRQKYGASERRKVVVVVLVRDHLLLIFLQPPLGYAEFLNGEDISTADAAAARETAL